MAVAISRMEAKSQIDPADLLIGGSCLASTKWNALENPSK